MEKSAVILADERGGARLAHHVTYYKKRVSNGEKPVFRAENLHTRKKALTKIGFVLY
ncbi:MAG: hypothetical protein K2M42_11010 [Oscillospiraceae bacterium]|nr:hypothetical protein [Oscillospiraceae bacterium]